MMYMPEGKNLEIHMRVWKCNLKGTTVYRRRSVYGKTTERTVLVTQCTDKDLVKWVDKLDRRLI